MKNVVDVVKSFQVRPINAEQAERQAAVRKAAASFAAVIHQATREGEFRGRAIQLVHESLMYVAAAIEAEDPSEKGIEARSRIVEKLAAGKSATAREVSVLRGMLGMFSPEDLEPLAPAGGGST